MPAMTVSLSSPQGAKNVRPLQTEVDESLADGLGAQKIPSMVRGIPPFCEHKLASLQDSRFPVLHGLAAFGTPATLVGTVSALLPSKSQVSPRDLWKANRAPRATPPPNSRDDSFEVLKVVQHPSRFPRRNRFPFVFVVYRRRPRDGQDRAPTNPKLNP